MSARMKETGREGVLFMSRSVTNTSDVPGGVEPANQQLTKINLKVSGECPETNKFNEQHCMTVLTQSLVYSF